MVLDLSDVTFLGSAGLAVLIAAKDEAAQRKCRLRLVPGSRIVTRAREGAALLTLFEVADGVPQALDRVADASSSSLAPTAIPRRQAPGGTSAGGV